MNRQGAGQEAGKAHGCAATLLPSETARESCRAACCPSDDREPSARACQGRAPAQGTQSQAAPRDLSLRGTPRRVFPAAEDGRALCVQQQSAAEELGKTSPRQRAEHPSRRAVESAHGPATPLRAHTQKKQRESLQDALAHPCSWQRSLQNQTVDAAVWPVHTTEQNPALKS